MAAVYVCEWGVRSLCRLKAAAEVAVDGEGNAK